jgi:hypothetical protein
MAEYLLTCSHKIAGAVIDYQSGNHYELDMKDEIKTAILEMQNVLKRIKSGE